MTSCQKNQTFHKHLIKSITKFGMIFRTFGNICKFFKSESGQNLNNIFTRVTQFLRNCRLLVHYILTIRKNTVCRIAKKEITSIFGNLLFHVWKIFDFLSLSISVFVEMGTSHLRVYGAQNLPPIL